MSRDRASTTRTHHVAARFATGVLQAHTSRPSDFENFLPVMDALVSVTGVYAYVAFHLGMCQAQLRGQSKGNLRLEDDRMHTIDKLDYGESTAFNGVLKCLT